MVTLTVDDQKDSAALMKFMLEKIDPLGTHKTASTMQEALDKTDENVQIIFLDIEMPGLNGIDGANLLKKMYPRLNIIFVTGHPQYLRQAYGLHPSGFLEKPVCEQDILDELEELRFPLPNYVLKVKCSPFCVFVDNMPYDFGAAKTTELFAYLVYKKGGYCTNSELCRVLWGFGDEKRSRLRQLIMELRGCFEKLSAPDMLLRKYGSIGLDISQIEIDGNTDGIKKYYGWE